MQYLIPPFLVQESSSWLRDAGSRNACGCSRCAVSGSTREKDRFATLRWKLSVRCSLFRSRQPSSGRCEGFFVILLFSLCCSFFGAASPHAVGAREFSSVSSLHSAGQSIGC